MVTMWPFSPEPKRTTTDSFSAQNPPRPFASIALDSSIGSELPFTESEITVGKWIPRPLKCKRNHSGPGVASTEKLPSNRNRPPRSTRRATAWKIKLLNKIRIKRLKCNNFNKTKIIKERGKRKRARKHTISVFTPLFHFIFYCKLFYCPFLIF